METGASDVALYRALTLMTRQVQGALERRLQRDAGVSLPDFDILRALQASPEGRSRSGALGQMLDWEKSQISHQVRRMEARGLIERVVCDSDARGTWVAITAEGAGRLNHATPAYEDEIARFLGGVAATEDGAAVGRVALQAAAVADLGECHRELDDVAQALGTSAPAAS